MIFHCNLFLDCLTIKHYSIGSYWDKTKQYSTTKIPSRNHYSILPKLRHIIISHCESWSIWIILTINLYKLKWQFKTYKKSFLNEKQQQAPSIKIWIRFVLYKSSTKNPESKIPNLEFWIQNPESIHLSFEYSWNKSISMKSISRNRKKYFFVPKEFALYPTDGAVVRNLKEFF